MRRDFKSVLCCLLIAILTLLSVTELYADVQIDTNTDSHSGGSVVVEAEAAYPEAPDIDGEAGILIDMDTGAILYQKNANEKLYPASITKIMTALLAVENLALDSTFTFTQDIIGQLPYDAAKYGYVAGEQVTIRDCLYVLMLRSANEVAIGLGIDIAGSEEEFGKLMTERAKEAGALNTNFVNASGLHDSNHYTTAYDMAMIAMDAMKNPTFAEIWGNANYVVMPTNVQPDVVRIWNRHEMLVSTTANYYQYAIGGKTGYTDEAGKTLVTCASKDGMNLVCVVMKSGASTVYSDTRALFEYGFNNFQKVSVQGNESRFGQSDSSYFISHDNLFSQSSKLLELGDEYVTIPKNASLGQVGYTLEYSQDEASNDIAYIRYMIGENYLGETTLKLSVSQSTEQELSLYKEKVEEQEDDNNQLTINVWWVLGIIAVIIILIFVFYSLRKTKVRRKAKRNRKKLFKNKKWK